MKKVTVNGNDHELSPDSPRSRSHVELLQDMVTSINNLETGTTPDGIELTSTQSAKNVISSYTTDADTTNAALTFHNTVANGSNELEFNFTDNANASLLKIDNEGDVTIAGGLTCTTVTASGALSAAGISSSGATTALTSTSANLITSATSDANTTVAVAGLTFKNTTAHTSGDLEFEFQKSTGGSLLSIDNEGQADLAGSFTCTGGVATDGLTTPVAGAFTTADTGGTLADATNYYYRISAINDVGESLACAEVAKSTGAGPTGTHTITAVWGTVPGATGYKVYGRTTGAEQLIETVAQGTLSYVDAGYIAPSGALPTYNTTSGLRMTALTPNVITSATNASNASATVAATTFKNTAALDANDLEFNFVRSDDTSLLNVDKEGDATLGGSLTFAGATAPVVTTSATAGNISGDTAALNFQHTATLNADTFAYAFKNQSGTKLFWIDRVGHIFNNGNAYLGNVAFSADYRALPLAGTLGSGTGITTNVSSALRHLFHKITVTEAALTDADTSQAVTIWTAPAKARILRIVADVTTAFTGGGVTACTLQVGIAGGDADAYIVASDVFSGAVTLGDVEADLGTALSNAGTGVGAYPNWGGTKAIAAQFDTVTANVADLTAGSVTFYIEYVSYAE